MDLKNLNPWNWFKHEEASDKKGGVVPVRRSDTDNGSLTFPTQQNPLLALHQEMERVFDQAFNNFGLPPLRSAFFGQTAIQGQGGRFLNQDGYQPQIDISCTDRTYQIKLDVPGLHEEDLDIELTGDVLTVRGQKQEKTEISDKHFYRMERRSGLFQRTLALPEDAVGEDITARLAKGVLSLGIPRRETADRASKKIAINQ